jgi:vacuolar-type H+-ATPase subunit F/Vma7
MSRIAVLGESPRVDGWALAGATVLAAEGSDAVTRAWEALPGDVAVVVLSPQAALLLGERTGERLVVCLP